MSISTISKHIKSLSFLSTLLLGTVLLVGLQACGGSSSSDKDEEKISDQDASGLYKSGTGTLDDTSVSDIIGFVQGNRVMAFSVTAHILIDGTITSITGNNYEATVSVYKTGELSQSNINVTGTVTTESSIEGTLNGTGTGAGSFNLTFDPLYSRPATNDRVNSESLSVAWAGDIYSMVPNMATNNLDVNSLNEYSATLVDGGPSFIQCLSGGDITIPDTSKAIYSMEEILFEGSDCPASMKSAPYTGLSAVVDNTSTDDTWLYAVTNGATSYFAIFTKTF